MDIAGEIMEFSDKHDILLHDVIFILRFSVMVREFTLKEVEEFINQTILACLPK